MFRAIISSRADVVWRSRSCDLTLLGYYMWGAVKDKCYAEEPETIGALKDNIRKAIGEIQQHTIDNVLKNWTNRVGYWMARRGSHLLTYLIGHNIPFRRLCFVCANANWSHQSLTGLLRFEPFNGYNDVLFTDFRRSPHQIPVSLEHPPPYERHGRASAAAGYYYAAQRPSRWGPHTAHCYIVLSNKKSSWRKYSAVFLKHFIKKSYLGDPVQN